MRRLDAWARSAAEAWEVPRDLLLRRYPRFVTGGPLAPGEIPVFVLHSVLPDDFTRKLRHLADNGYETLGVDDYVAVIRGRRKPPARAVLLTFDDGRGSLWSVAAPLLRRFGMRAVVFLVPGRMSEGSAPLAPTWDDVLAGRVAAEAVLGRETSDAGALLSWNEVEALARTGLFEFQSHTLEHARVHTSPELVGFVTPASRVGYAAFDQPLLRQDGRDLLGAAAPLGAPLFRSAPRMGGARRFFEDEGARARCAELVASHGGDAFFARADWEPLLRRALAAGAVGGALEGEEDRSRAIARELGESRRRIEERTGRPVVHLCYPWHTASALARRMAVEAGYETEFCGKVAGVPLTLPGGDLRQVARLGEDYLELLPGAGRATLAEVVRRKWRRRFGRTLG